MSDGRFIGLALGVCGEVEVRETLEDQGVRTMRYVLAVMLMLGCDKWQREQQSGDSPDEIKTRATKAVEGHVPTIEEARAINDKYQREWSAAHPAPPPRPMAVKTSQLIADYEASEIAGDVKYKGKRLRFRGEVGNIGVTMGDPVITVGGKYGGVKCFFRKESSEYIARLRRGDLVVFDGTCRGGGLAGGVVMHDCAWPSTEQLKRENPELLKPVHSRSNDDE